MARQQSRSLRILIADANQAGGADVRNDRVHTRASLDLAKKALMTAHGFTESAAYLYIRSQSMNTRRPMSEVSEWILRAIPLLQKTE